VRRRAFCGIVQRFRLCWPRPKFSFADSEQIFMIPADPYGRTDKLADSLLDVLVARLEARGKHPFFEQMLTEYLDVMQIGKRGRSWIGAVGPELRPDRRRGAR
jgi:hypothetical protein